VEEGGALDGAVSIGDSGVDGDSGPDGSAGDAGDASDAALLEPDPCPTGAIAINCSTTCDPGTNGPCTQVACNQYWDFANTPDVYRTQDAILRTPDRPGVDKSCQDNCTLRSGPGYSPHRVYGMAFNPDDRFLYRIRVGAPWVIEQERGNYPIFCPSDTDPPPNNDVKATGCTILGGGPVLISTDDPNAPARNVYIEQVASLDAGCP
jgi:hypothetical protein